MREAVLEALPRLRRFARSLTGNLHDADDLLQSTVERMLSRTVPDDVDVTRWMFRVCRNLWIDEVRAREVRSRTAARPDLQGEHVVEGEDVVIGELTLREVDRAVSTLPAEQREVLSLVAVEGLSYREAAEILEIPIGTIMSRLSRARAALAQHFEQLQPAREADGSSRRKHVGEPG